MKSIYNLIAFLFISTSIAQTIPQKKIPEYYDYPFEEWYQPLHIRMNAVLLKKDDGSGSFNLKNKEEKAYFEEFLEKTNQVFANFVPLKDKTNCYNGNDFIKDSRIRFDYNTIEVHNTYYWNYLNSGSIPEQKKYAGFSPTENWYIKALDDSISNLNRPKAINVYFTENGNRFDDLYKKKGEGFDVSGNMAAQGPNEKKLNRSSQIHVPNNYVNYLFQRHQSPKNFNKSWNETKTWWINAGFAHEIGHDLGLHHANEYYKTNQCIYTLMSQKHDHPRNWLPPTEIKKMHWNLTRTNLMQFVTPESAYGATWILKENTEWNRAFRFYHNFELAKGVTLKISDSIILPPQSYIKLNKDSKIIFKGKGKIVDAFGKEYKNFEKHRSAKIIYE